MRFLLAAFSLAVSWPMAAQTSGIDENWFLEQVRAHHPLMRRAATVQELAEAQEMQARGAFDPKLGASWKDKTYAGSIYETQGGPEVTWETPVGVGLRAGWKTAEGDRLDASDYVPEGGLWSMGGTIRLGRGLWTDKRRATLAKAKAMVGVGEAERTLAENDVLLNAAADYWGWYRAHLIWEVAREAEALALERLEWSRARLISGEGAALDTLEAHWNWNTRMANRAEGEGKLVQAKAKVDRWLWNEDWTPAMLPPLATPTPVLLDHSALAAANLWDSADPKGVDAIWEGHPYRQLYASKSEALRADVRLGREMLKPQVDGAFEVYSPVAPGAEEWSMPQWDNNHRVELKVSMPLFLRQERGALNVAKLNREQTLLDLQSEQANWTAHVRGTAQRLPLLLAQHENTGQAVDLARQLLDAEQLKFAVGESSLFVVNSRENALLNAQKTHANATATLHFEWRNWLWYLGQTDLPAEELRRVLLAP